MESKGSRSFVRDQGNFSFDKDRMNEINYEKRSVINLTNSYNPLGDNGVDRVDMVGMHVYFLYVETLGKF